MRGHCGIKKNSYVWTVEYFYCFIKQKITEVNGKKNMLEIMLEDANRLLKFYLTKKTSLIEGELLSLDLKAWSFILLFFLILQYIYYKTFQIPVACFGVCMAPSDGDFAKWQSSLVSPCFQFRKLNPKFVQIYILSDILGSLISKILSCWSVLPDRWDS